MVTSHVFPFFIVKSKFYDSRTLEVCQSVISYKHVSLYLIKPQVKNWVELKENPVPCHKNL